MEYKSELEQNIATKVKGGVTKAVKIMVFILFMIAVVFVIGYVVMRLWNWLMPDLFGLTTIDYWQAIGVLVLAKIIFGFGSGNGPKRRSKRHTKPFGKEKPCHELRRDFSEWKHYDEFWNTEGKKAFEDFIARKEQH